ncbi:elongation factor-like GTPase 1 [Procambarus clarkii]|uniref:elongation factor-like GTPase 1 n=1 Tax=Procambarus clarkii TaxID=6728 RepID=UPI001E678CBA|nr:elongation factor-like GTPase 1 isoform X2 [Procambarus clarkii]XP_045616085.1 elongation factor-like GTPase 1 isoform X2 [Procambarus clarkii]
MVVGGGGTPGRLPTFLSNPHTIRNLCIMAHVDHGKTSLADAMVASNGLISQRQAGRIRYMDSRKDEMERGITMKSSCVSLAYSRPDGEYIINLIDSPGHVDFSSEVSTAVRLCDGTIIVVDVVEGVCAQTKVVLHQAWVENIRPVLLLNKIDRLILETKMSPIECYYHIAQVLEQVNAYMGELYNTAVLGKTSEEIERRRQAERERKLSERERRASESEIPEAQLIFADWGIDTVDDSELYFSPELGNVVFASAYDGWGFGIHHFANQFSAKLGMNKAVLNKTLWGDYYITTKGGQKKIVSGARDKRKNPLFVTLILENLYKVYDTIMIRKDKDETEKLAEALGVKIPLSVLRSADMRLKLNFLCSGWLPLAPAVLEMVVEHLPSAANMSEDRATKLMCSATQRFDSLPPETQKLKEAFMKCSSDENEPLIVYVSKMFGVQRRHLPEDRSSGVKVAPEIVRKGMLSENEIAKRREELRRRKEASMVTTNVESSHERSLTEKEIEGLKKQQEQIVEEKQRVEDERQKWMNEEVFIAFARVFSGTLRAGQKVYVLSPKHDPSSALALTALGEEELEEKLKDYKHIHTCKISGIYLLLGREFELLESAGAGTVVGITGLEDCVIKSATLSSTLAMPPFTELTMSATPILRVAVEPHDPRDLPKLRSGLKLLNQADPCVQVMLHHSGEYVILTAGEVHLQRCVDDLQERYAGVPIRTSDPIVPFRETIIPSPTVDRLNEAIEGENINIRKVDNSDPLGVVEVNGRLGKLRCRAVSLPHAVTKLLEQNEELLKLVTVASATDRKNTYSVANTVGDSSLELEEKPAIQLSALGEALENRQKLKVEAFRAIKEFKTSLDKAFRDAGAEWENAVNEIWSFGPNDCGPNILLNRIQTYCRPSVWEKAVLFDSPLAAYDTNFVTGFQIATAAGPLCEEPMMGVCFIIEDWSLAPSREPESGEDQFQTSGISSGQIISLSKDTLRKAFEHQCQRLVCAMYSCVINVTSEVVGKMYSVIGKRQGRIVDGDITEGSTSWNITAYLPVVESMNFANELRKSTSGEAMPQLVFSHWEVLDIDPFWEPQTTEELAHWGEKSDSGNIARKYINSVRKRKGLAIDEKIVEFAEKQRTLSKNK